MTSILINKIIGINGINIYITIFYLVIKKDVIKLNYFEAYKTIWNYHKKYSDVKGDETYWQAVAAESENIAKQYNNEKFIVSLLLAVNDELQRVYLEEKRKIQVEDDGNG